MSPFGLSALRAFSFTHTAVQASIAELSIGTPYFSAPSIICLIEEGSSWKELQGILKKAEFWSGNFFTSFTEFSVIHFHLRKIISQDP